MVYLFDEKISTPLCEIMGRNKSDKGSINIQNSWHNYTTFYYSIFKDMCNKNLRIYIIFVNAFFTYKLFVQI